MYYVKTPEPMADEWFDTREEADAYAIAWLEEHLRVWGEGHDDSCYVMQVVAETWEVVGARRGDGSERGEWLEERKLDYEIERYTCRHFDVAGPVGDSITPALQAEHDYLASEVQRLRDLAQRLAVYAEDYADLQTRGEISGAGRYPPSDVMADVILALSASQREEVSDG